MAERTATVVAVTRGTDEAGGASGDDAPRRRGTGANVDSMRARMERGELYLADDPELKAANLRAQRLLDRYNAPGFADARPARDALLRELLGEIGDGVTILPTFRCDYGSRISIGAGTFVNYGAIALDVAAITIGAACQIATGVQLLTATHPVDPVARRAGWESGAPIVLGDNVWLGGGVIVCPGVTIGADTVVGAGAVVTRDLPAGVVAVGNPARVRRPITDDDRVMVPFLPE
jgi:maltose O-acetyltransferase